VRRLGELEASIELAQEVFVVAWRRRGQVPDRDLPWLYGVARKLLANEWRARRSTPVPLAIADSEPRPTGSESDSVVVMADLYAAMATLSEADQEILRLVGWEQLTVAEAATVLDCSRTAAAVRLHRARRRLSAALEPAGSSSIGPRPTVEKGLV
jgi:RNA polymerase sigma-70 factor (ECF subfamily)